MEVTRLPTLDLTESQVRNLVEQLSESEQEKLLRSMLSRRYKQWKSFSESDESRIRLIAAGRDKHWDRMTEEEREDFIQELCEEN
jgi:uncharacterized protein YceH (UPF0502 family)